MRAAIRSLALALSSAMIVVLLGCGQSPPDAKSGPGPGPTVSSGNAVYDQHCLKCHPIGGGGGGGGPKGMGGPSLAKVAADPAHTPEWLAEHVKNPRAHKPDSKMPGFDGKLSAEDLKSVTDFMSKMK